GAHRRSSCSSRIRETLFRTRRRQASSGRPRRGSPGPSSASSSISGAPLTDLHVEEIGRQTSIRTRAQRFWLAAGHDANGSITFYFADTGSLAAARNSTYTLPETRDWPCFPDKFER